MSGALEAHAVMVAAGLDGTTALRALTALHDAGFLITKPQDLVDSLVTAALAAPEDGDR